MNNNILHWSYRDLKMIPNQVQVAGESVEEIYLKENFIEVLPLWLFQLTNLKFIHLSGNLISTIPDDLKLLVHLEFLDLSKNKLKRLPPTIGSVCQLKSLNLSDNEIEYIPKEIGFLRQLEVFDMSKNRLKTVPNELGNCTSLLELNFQSNNRLTEIPTRVVALYKLIYFNADNCSLNYLPYAVGNRLIHVRVFNNTRLSHYPAMYEKFLQPWMEPLPIHNPSLDPSPSCLFKVFSLSENRWFNLPRGVVNVFSRVQRTPMCLFELCVRTIYQSYWGEPLDHLLSEFVPSVILDYIKMGPIGHCGNGYCSNPLFKECYFLLVKRTKTRNAIVFSAIFCSKDCADFWLVKYRNYYEIDWTNNLFY